MTRHPGKPDTGSLEATSLPDPSVLLEQVLDTIPSGLFMVDRCGTITAWNRAMEEITGHAPEEVIGKSCAVIRGDACFRGAAVPSVFGGCELFSGSAVIGKRCTLARRDGTRIPVLKNARVIHDSLGRVVGGIEALVDLSGVRELEDQLARLRREASRVGGRGRLLGGHPAMLRLYDMIDHAARTSLSVLLLGETGTGKELVAHAIHSCSERRDGPFVRVACSALSEPLLESELFGHIRGAFTGAIVSRKGRFEAAHGGTLLLDEIGDVSPNVQTKLLRVLQEREIERVGDNRSVPVDIRVIAASNCDLADLCRQGRFRWDLYYRLAVIPIAVPPLRDRMDDVPVLVEAFVERLNRSLGRSIRGVSGAAMDRLMAYDWPGNVRELEHAIEFAFVVTHGSLIDAAALPPTVRVAPPSPATEGTVRRSTGMPSRETVAAALAGAGGHRGKAAEQLGVSRVTLWKWLKRLGLEEGVAASANGNVDVNVNRNV